MIKLLRFKEWSVMVPDSKLSFYEFSMSQVVLMPCLLKEQPWLQCGHGMHGTRKLYANEATSYVSPIASDQLMGFVARTRTLPSSGPVGNLCLKTKGTLLGFLWNVHMTQRSLKLQTSYYLYPTKTKDSPLSLPSPMIDIVLIGQTKTPLGCSNQRQVSVSAPGDFNLPKHLWSHSCRTVPDTCRAAASSLFV